MYCNQSVSNSGRQYQAYHWRNRYHLPYKVLSIFIHKSMLATLLVLMAQSSLAEPSYYTWVDAQGVIHNTPIDSDSSSNQGEISSEDLGDTVRKESTIDESDSVKTVDEESYKTEEEFQQALKSSNDKPFYTYTDADGTIRNSPKPDIELEFVATEIVYDAVFAPPFRLPENITRGVCCIEYKNNFEKKLKRHSLIGQKINHASALYKTQRGNQPAAFFEIDNFEKEILFIKGYQLSRQAKFEVIALNEHYQPIYLASNLAGLYIEQTWKDLAYNKVMLEISDVDVKYLIIFAVDDDLNMERGYSLNLSQGRASD